MTLTFDTNCLLQIENGEPPAVYLRPLLEMCNQDNLVIQVPAISASESPRTGQVRSINGFIQRLRNAGLGRCKLLPTIGYWDITFWEYTVLATEGSLKLEHRIHEILFPTIPCEYTEFCKSNPQVGPDGTIQKRWLNAKCDVAAMWCHLKHRGNVFVTSDLNFHKQSRKNLLIALGANEIATPEQALETVRRAQLSPDPSSDAPQTLT